MTAIRFSATRTARRVAASLSEFRGDRSGATAIEYGLLASGISLVVIATTFALGQTVATAFDTVATALQTGIGT